MIAPAMRTRQTRVRKWSARLSAPGDGRVLKTKGCDSVTIRPNVSTCKIVNRPTDTCGLVRGSVAKYCCRAQHAAPLRNRAAHGQLASQHRGVIDATMYQGPMIIVGLVRF